MQMKLAVYDATLREGAQGAGAYFTVEEKLRIANLLDQLGISYVEGGNPSSNPKDMEFYARAPKLKTATLVAFGATCKHGMTPENDENVQALLRAETPAVALVGKSWDFQVRIVLGTTLEENLDMIYSTIAYFKAQGREVIFDAEHFFDGFKGNPSYSLKVMQAAKDAGTDWICMCDTNGGCFSHEVEQIVAQVRPGFEHLLGIHCHNDTGMAEANSIAAVRSGALMVQGTLNGWGERCGNADICTLLPNLQYKLGYSCIEERKLRDLTQVSRKFNRILNTQGNLHAPYVGTYAFAHKAGMHIDAVQKNTTSFEHIAPEAVGNKREFLLSEQAGRTAVLERVLKIAPGISRTSPELKRILDRLKQLENNGYQFELADASFELLVRREMQMYKPFFELKGFKVTVDQPSYDYRTASAWIDIGVGGEREISADLGDGPLDALNNAARRALERFYPSLKDVRLTDFKVNVLDSEKATGSTVRVVIESSDNDSTWTTVGVSKDIIYASWYALVDSLEYKLLKDEIKTDD